MRPGSFNVLLPGPGHPLFLPELSLCLTPQWLPLTHTAFPPLSFLTFLSPKTLTSPQPPLLTVMPYRPHHSHNHSVILSSKCQLCWRDFQSVPSCSPTSSLLPALHSGFLRAFQSVDPRPQLTRSHRTSLSSTCPLCLRQAPVSPFMEGNDECHLH